MALDFPIGAAAETTAIAGCGARHRSGGERGFAVALDARAGGRQRKDSRRNRTAFFYLAGGRGQFRPEIGAPAPARKYKCPLFEIGGGAAGPVADRAGFLRTLKRGLRTVPVPGTGARGNQPCEFGGASCRALRSSLVKGLFPKAAGGCLAAMVSGFGFFIGTGADSSLWLLSATGA